MEVEEYALTVLAYKNSIIRICWLMEAVGLIGMIAVGIFVYRGLKIKSIGFGRDKASLACCIMVVLTLFMLFTAIFTANDVSKCEQDIENSSYEKYVGEISYTPRNVRLCDIGLSLQVSGGFSRMPRGENYGRCVYSSRSKVIVDYQPLDRP